ncbi:MAG: hypothetical protein JOZ07_02800 [Solirubrobacterales bacterium]|nr:hypothetical protein [Solirubrobacterales bacterium]
MERSEDPERLADELEGDSDEMDKRSGELEDKISDAREDWDRKRKAPGIPGAPPPDDDA